MRKIEEITIDIEKAVEHKQEIAAGWDYIRNLRASVAVEDLGSIWAHCDMRANNLIEEELVVYRRIDSLCREYRRVTGKSHKAAFQYNMAGGIVAVED